MVALTDSLFPSFSVCACVCVCMCVQVVSRCDICLLQHVVDSDGKAIKALLSKLNRYSRLLSEEINIVSIVLVSGGATKPLTTTNQLYRS